MMEKNFEPSGHPGKKWRSISPLNKNLSQVSALEKRTTQIPHHLQTTLKKAKNEELATHHPPKPNPTTVLPQTRKSRFGAGLWISVRTLMERTLKNMRGARRAVWIIERLQGLSASRKVQNITPGEYPNLGLFLAWGTG
ncbi:uncharacterized protein VP01_1875g5 [Puccinia sorghi]|uniref:Uncharacterized protein n=1 Tax=Puccinia sorghi TaxID=27349 RepID=A0A0L6VF21_9BASI|nr:uncharacterized protein VP01_1875g5 [Puccinia sorghi]